MKMKSNIIKAVLIVIFIICLPSIPIYFSSVIYGLLANSIVVIAYFILLYLFGIGSLIEMGIFAFILSILVTVITSNLIIMVGV